ncbi:MAG: BrnT family toxin [Burkholderiales bacterium]|nr:BrnT family toxin [Burkholderiales bacterium]
MTLHQACAPRTWPVTFEDKRFDYSEERFVTLGPLGDMLVVVVTAETADHIRIISMRKADRHEQAIYRENLT